LVESGVKLASKVRSADRKRPLGRDAPSVLTDGGSGAPTATCGAAITPDKACGVGLPVVAAAYAARTGYIAASPCDALTRRERPKPGRPKDRFLTPSEIKRLLEHSEGTADLIVPMLLFSGLRVAELLGLTWHDIDFNQHVIRVRYQMSRKGKRTPLKTDAGRRDVIMMNELARLLRKKRLSARFSADDDLIVGNGVGRTLGHTKLLKAFTKSASDAGIEGVTPHTCRHTFASILIDKGADVEFASDQLVDKGDEFARRVRGAAACERGRRLRESAGERRAAGSELVRCRVAARDVDYAAAGAGAQTGAGGGRWCPGARSARLLRTP
jgi:hypothetical protein